VDPFSLLAIGNAGLGLFNGIYDAATLPARKREYMREQKRQIGQDYSLQKIARMLPRTAAELAPQVQLQNAKRQADKQFQFDPRSLIPFLQSGAQAASAIYGAAQPGPQAQRLAPDPVLRAQQAAAQAAAAQEQAAAAEFFKRNGWPGYGSSW